MKHALYIIGEPGVGKSTLVETLKGDALAIGGRYPLAHQTYLTTAGGVVELGTREPGKYGGTDALSMSAIVQAEAWVTDGSWLDDSLLLAEGDRLACDRFFNALLDGGWHLRICHLDGVTPATAEARRERRGSAQNGSWIRGRQTKVQRILERWDWTGRVFHLDAREAPDSLAYQAAQESVVAANLYAEVAP